MDGVCSACAAHSQKSGKRNRDIPTKTPANHLFSGIIVCCAVLCCAVLFIVHLMIDNSRINIGLSCWMLKTGRQSETITPAAANAGWG